MTRVTSSRPGTVLQIAEGWQCGIAEGRALHPQQRTTNLVQ
ncbi:hypothetical protein ACNKHL_16995 [Shigella flexneri]